MDSMKDLEEKLKDAGQAHILGHYSDLSSSQKASLNAFVRTTDFARLNRILDASLALLNGAKGNADANGADVAPPPDNTIFDVEKERGLTTRESSLATAAATVSPVSRYIAYEDAGYELISQSKTAVLLMAGGSGTRLGVHYPKGLFTFDHEDTDEPLLQQHSKSLFQFHCEKLRKAENLACERTGRRGKIRLLVMTSDQNDAETRQFFRSQRYFGLDAGQVDFFTQTSLPVYEADLHAGDCDGAGRPTHRVLMESAGAPLLAPGGNGGVYESLALHRAVTDAVASAEPQTGPTDALPVHDVNAGESRGVAGGSASALALIDELGIEYVQIFSVDNLLAKIGDPLFFGFTRARRCHVSVKTTPKVNPEERVGVFAKVGGQWGVVEYTELGRERSMLRRDSARVNTTTADPPKNSKDQESGSTEETGDLLFNCANIASHCCSTTFLKFAAVQMAEEVLYHAAVKKVKVHNGSQDCMAIKLEAFIFDMFRHCNDASVDGYAAATGVSPRPALSPAAKQTSTHDSDDAQHDRFGILQVDRNNEFAPIKNATAASSTDNPQTAATLYLNMTTQWVRELLEVAASALDDHHTHTSSLSQQERCATVEAVLKFASLAERSALGLQVKAALARLADPMTIPGRAGDRVYVEISPLVSYAGEGLVPYLSFLIPAILKAEGSAGGASEKRIIVLLDEKVEPSSKM